MSPVAGHSSANHQPPARNSRGRGYGRPGYGKNAPDRVFNPRRWNRSQGWKNWYNRVVGDRSVINGQRPHATVSHYNNREMPHGNVGGPLKHHGQWAHPGGPTNQRERTGGIMGGLCVTGNLQEGKVWVQLRGPGGTLSVRSGL
ncbi:hypothetical protein DPMN_080642 [Dreissena polymorpha]|uniref:Uncharacterized protein n=1 Tax=Dreissena polymorpha TaxID=45954 RepID=A0A9D3YUY1_DREPO|nr:hypothetical protein DPMN_080642 [Dreissena polymorpha]